MNQRMVFDNSAIASDTMIRIKKGLDLPISGQPRQEIDIKPVGSVALLGADYLGLHPALLVEEGDRVKRGQALFTDKHLPGVLFTAPAGGRVVGIHRGERRALLSVVIACDAEEAQETFNAYFTEELPRLRRELVVENLMRSGLWTAFRTRPFSKIPPVDATPHAIFITAMDTNPLAADPEVVLKGHERPFVHGATLLTRLTEGKVYLCKAPGSAIPLGNQSSVLVEEFAGPHPAGLPGTHIHFLDPVGKHKAVWQINYQDVIAIGHLFTTGALLVDRVIALAGPGVQRPRLIKTRLGASITDLAAGELNAGEQRLISGSVLQGRQAQGAEAFLGRYHQQVSVIEEGRQQELLGWIRPGKDKYSILNLFTSRRSGIKQFALSSNTGGSPRAQLPIESYEAVLPLDMLPTPLLRALLVQDTDTAQLLGCLELDEEDLALCTFVCPGKHDYGAALRANLDRIEKEG